MSKRKKSLSRLLAFLLCFCMTLSSLPVSAFATTENEVDEGTGITDTLPGDLSPSETEETDQSSPNTSPNDTDREAGDTTDRQSEDGRGPTSDEPAGPDEESPAPEEETPGKWDEQAQDRILTYEDGDVSIIVNIPAASGLPVDVQLKAERLNEDSDAYLTASERVSTDIGAGEGERLVLIPYSVWMEDGEGNEVDVAGESVSISATFKESLLEDTGNEETQPFIACISDTDDVRFFAPYTVETDMSSACVLGLGVILPAAEEDVPGSQEGCTPGDDSQAEDDKQDDEGQEGDGDGSQDSAVDDQTPFHFGYEDINLKASVEVPSDAGIPSDATLHVERANVQATEYETLLEALRAGLGMDSEQDVRFVPYDIYFTDTAGARIDGDGVRISIQMIFYEDVFALDGGSMSPETFMAMVGPDGEVQRLESLAADGSVAFDVELKAGTMIGPVMVSKQDDKAQKDFSGLMTMEELLALDIDVAGATMFHSDIMPLNMVSGTHWTFDIYYVNEDDYNNVHKTDDFSLKYQMEFHASQNFERGEVKIRIPRALLKYRDGTPFNPTDIAVPQVKDMTESIETNNSPFNYYIETGEDDVEYLVFFNYEQIISGTNAAWQVVFSHLRSMKIVDGTKWSLQADAEVKYAAGGVGDTEKASPAPLTGDVDTEAVLLSITKEPYTFGGSYCPGLYTESQAADYISGAMPEDFSGDNFRNYKYVVWKVNITGRGNQPFDLWIDDDPGQNGRVVGYKGLGSNTVKDIDIPERYRPDLKTSLNGWKNVSVLEESSSWSKSFYVVVAYPGTVKEGDLLTNEVHTTLVPYDLVDKEQTKSADAKWNYRNYDWIYMGDIIGIEKWVQDENTPAESWVHSTESAGWLEVYKQSIAKGTDAAHEFDFKTESICRSFMMTHYIDAKTGELGERKPGTATRVVTVDDAVYAYPGGTEDKILLTGEDYYFSSIKIKQIDNGYDVYEDLYGAPEDATADDNIDQGIKIYAMFAKSGKNETAGTSPDKWEYVGETEWPGAGTGTYVDLEYTFSPEDIAREPYRVMVVHDTINYNTICDIYVSLHIRKDSPVMAKMMADDPNLFSVQFENVSGVSGQELSYGMPDTGVGTESYFDGTIDPDSSSYFHDMRVEHGNYSEQDLIDFTKGLYGMLLMRDCALVMGKGIGRDAQVFKTGSLSNDIHHERANATYNLTMYEGYIVGSRELAGTLMSEYGLEAPNRKSVVFYDLLPYGMKLDPSYQIAAGRITDLTGSYKSQPKEWDAQDVSVTVDEVDINYNGTGRTLVAFRVDYSGDTAYEYSSGDKSIDDSGHLFEGWGVNFRGYWDFSDISDSDFTQNICAVMPADNDPFIAMDNQAYDDNGVHPESNEDDFEPFGPDIDNDGQQEKKSVMYAKAILTEEFAYASTSSIEKLVRADEDKFGEYGTSAVVTERGGYTYDISVTDSSKPITNIVIFDRLENAIQDRTDLTALGYTSVPGDMEFESSSWQGTFKSVITQGLKDRGIDYTVYYNASRNAKLPEARTDPMTVLNSANGWIEESEWERLNYPMSDVKAIAVSLGDYVLQSLQTISLQICMDAPDYAGTGGATWAYNNSSFYSKVVTTEPGANAAQTVVGNSVRVRLGRAESFEVIKEYADGSTIPSELKGQPFTFNIYDNVDVAEKRPFVSQTYKLYDRDTDGNWKLVPGLWATDADGSLTLNAGQKAVFTGIADSSRIEVQEASTPFWEPELTESTADDLTTFTVRNKVRSVLYVQKKVLGGTPEDDELYTFQLLVNGQPAANVPYWKVDYAYTDGRLPVIEETGGGTTNQNGRFSIHAGEVIAILGAGDFGDMYQVIEQDIGNDWFTDVAEWSGTFDVKGSSVVITNHYKWKDLYLTKKVDHQDAEDAVKQDFTFKIEKVTEQADGSLSYEPIVGNAWELLADKEPIASGKLDDQGSLTCKAAAGIIHISGLAAGERIRITEILESTTSGSPRKSFYEAVNGGVVEVVMPLYAKTSSAEITNNWMKRPLSVSKTLVYDFEDPAEAALAKKAVFEMTVKADTDGDGVEEPLSNYPFVLTESGTEVKPGDANDPYAVNGSSVNEFRTDASGKFYIMGSQTAVFKDAAPVGSTFTVTETQNVQYRQISPTGNAPFTGKIEGEGGSASFVNGIAKGLVIQKEYIGADDAGTKFIEKARSGDSELMSRLAVDIELTVTMTDGRTIRFPSVDTQVILVSQDNSVTQKTWKAGEPFSLYPWEILVITSGLEGVRSYSVKESAEDQHWIADWTDDDKILHHIQNNQKVPDNDAAAAGTLSEDPMVTFVNEISETGEQSKIRKRLLDLGAAIPTGARLVLQVERYEGGIWKTAGDVPYILYDEAGPVSDRIMHTGKDGRIQLIKTDNGNPYIVFPQDSVYVLDVLEPDSGDMRIREIIEESDPEWGRAVGVGGWTDNEHYTTDLSELDRSTADINEAFVNVTSTTSVRLGKVVEGDSNETFTFILRQITDVDGEKYQQDGGITPDNYQSVITKTKAQSGIHYTVYDATTNRPISEGSTDENGTIRLQGGQFAELSLPEGTLWTVSEDVPSGFVLKDMTEKAGTSRIGKLTDNLMLIGQDIDYQFEGVEPAAMLFSDGTLVFSYYIREEDPKYGSLVAGPWYRFEKDKYSSYSSVPWYANRSNIEKVKFEMEVAPISTAYWFYECSNLKAINAGYLDTSHVTDMRNMFYHCSSLTGVDVGSWETGNVTNMSNLFNGCGGLTTLAVDNWHTDMVTDMTMLFADCDSLSALNINNWNVSNVSTMNGTFSNCGSLTELDLSRWETDSLRSINSLFYKCKALETLNVGSWNTSGVTSMNNVFQDCSSLGTFDISTWDTDNVTSMQETFSGCSSLTALDVSKWKTSKVNNMRRMFSNCTSLQTLDLLGWNTDAVTSIDSMFQLCSSLATIYAHDWALPNVTSSTNVFTGCTRLAGITGIGITYSSSKTNHTYCKISGGYFTDPDAISYALLFEDGTLVFTSNNRSVDPEYGELIGGPWTGFDTKSYSSYYSIPWYSNRTSIKQVEFEKTIKPISTAYWFYGCSELISVNGKGLDTSQVTSMKSMFYNCSNLTTLDVSGWDTSSVTDMSSIFYNCSLLTTLNVSGWETGSVTTMNSMFYRCSALTTLDVGDWKTDGVTDMTSMFYYCSLLSTLDVGGWETGSVSNMASMFYSCSALTTLDVGDWKTDSVTNMGNMFSGCSSLTTLDVSGWKTGKVTKMNNMFSGCSLLTTLNVSGWETGSVTSMSSMFYNCSLLATLNVSGWKTDSVTNMSSMFYNCSSLTTLDVSGWETGSVTTMNSMFYRCSALTTLNLSNWDTSRVTSMDSMFSTCTHLNILNVGTWNTGNVANMMQMFTSCSDLTTLDLSNWDTSNVTTMSNMFYSCSSLSTIYAHDWTWTQNPTSTKMFFFCSKLAGHSLGGISYNQDRVDCTYCKSNGGYFTDPVMKASLPSSPSLDAAITFLQSLPLRK